MKRLLAVVSLAALVSGCGSSSTTPTPTPPAAVTKIITVSGNLAFGNVNIGSSADRTFTINNSGNATLTFTSFSCTGGSGPTGYTASPTSGTVAPGATLTIAVHFAPTTAGFLSCVLNVIGDQTGGGAAINVSGTGINITPLFTAAGTGNTVFDMPSTVARLHVVGNYTGSSSNFIVWVGPAGSACSVSIASGCRLLVNEIIGTFSGLSTTYDAVVQTGGGGVVSISNSSGVSWSFTEVR